MKIQLIIPIGQPDRNIIPISKHTFYMKTDCLCDRPLYTFISFICGNNATRHTSVINSCTKIFITPFNIYFNLFHLYLLLLYGMVISIPPVSKCYLIKTDSKPHLHAPGL